MAVWSPSHKLITGLDKYCPGVQLKLRNLSGGKVDVPSLLHSICLNEFCYQALYDNLRGSGIREILDVVLSSANLQTLELKSRHNPEIGLEDFTLRDIRSLSPLQEIRLVGRIFKPQALNQLENLIDWSRLQRLKVSPLKIYRTFLKRSQIQLSNLQSMAVGQNESEQLPIQNWSGDIGCPHDDDYAPPIYYSSLLHLNSLTELLLAKGANVNAHGGRYEYPLQAAIYSGDVATVEMLLRHGAQVNARSRIMGNALQMAACKSNTAIIVLLLDHGAEFASPGVMFDDVLQVCLNQHDVDLTIRFLNAGAPIRVPERYLWGCDIHGNGHSHDLLGSTDECIPGSASNSVIVYTLEGTRWSGLYSSCQNGRKFNTSFEIHTMVSVILNSVIPFQGAGEDEAGLFDIHGRLSPSTGLVSFIKIYASFHYMCSGKLQANGNTLIGRWGARKGDFGVFEVARPGSSVSIRPLRDSFVPGIG
ncbi:hypothetical protein MMC18_003926 [Xylographa bjoerkii]|nr:hypothetical protein [Xylographa bjoerkii]